LPEADGALFARLQSCWEKIASALGTDRPQADTDIVEKHARRSVERLFFVQLAAAKGLLPKNAWVAFSRDRHPVRPWGALTAALADRFGPGLFSVEPDVPGGSAASTGDPIPPLDDRALREAIAALDADGQLDTLGDRPTEILGAVHQWLLGRKLRRRPNGSYESSRSSQTRKRGGVFYTPDCVVRYIVRRLVAKPPCQQILDPACGCGWFLLAACRRLLDYSGDPGWLGSSGASPQKAGTRGLARLDPAHPGQLMHLQQLAKGLHGVDLDPDAVLAARRSLWLELAPGQTDSARRSLLETLTNNIRHGDVLNGDAFDGRADFFDAILGNPPYRRELNTKELFDRIAQTEFGRRWRSPRMDLWYYFVHRGLELLKPRGRLSFIVPSYWTAGSGSAKLIGALRESAGIEEIFLLDSLDVFPGVAGRHMILTITKGNRQRPTTIKRPATGAATDAEPFLSGTAPLVIFCKTADQLFRHGRIDLERPCDELLAKLARWPRLDSVGRVRQGIAENPASVTRATHRRHGGRWPVGEGVFALLPDELQRLDLSEREMELIRPYHDLSDLGRYDLAREPSLRLVYSTPETCPDIDAFPTIRRHLARFRPIMEARRETLSNKRPWWQLHWPRDETLWESPKLIALQMARRPSFVPAARPVYVSFSANVFVPDLRTPEHLNYFAAILNSRLIWKWCRHHAKRRGVGLELGGHVLRQTPIARIDFADASDRARHDHLVQLVDRIMHLTSQARAAPASPPDDEIAEVDRRIDAIVYALYRLTDEEIADIEIPAEYEEYGR
jgi:hypothetical protein